MNITDYLRDMGLLPALPPTTPPDEIDAIELRVGDHAERIERLEARVEVIEQGRNSNGH